MIAETIRQRLLTEQHPAPGHAEDMARFFKAFPGGYGEGDQFLAITVPVIRRVAKEYCDLSLDEITQLLDSLWHEVRLVAVLIMVLQFNAKKTDDAHRTALYTLYLKRTDAVNNWDIVDLSCRDIVGGYIVLHPEVLPVLDHLARSKNLWERRIAMVSTWQLIRLKQLDPAFHIAELLLHDTHDLIHKAVGWMLREAGKRDEDRLKAFLTQHIRVIPRTALRYAIERFTPEERQYFLKLK